MIFSHPLVQAHEALLTAAAQRESLQLAVFEQAKKISELEQEVQRVTSLLTQSELHLTDARQEITMLRGLLPDEATQRAFDSLSELLAAPAEDIHPTIRKAA